VSRTIINGPATALVHVGDAHGQGAWRLNVSTPAPRVFVYFRLTGNDIVGTHGRAALSPRISPPGAGGDG